MEKSIYIISIMDLLWIFIPVAVVIVIFKFWKLNLASPIHAIVRMFIQLILIGYILNYIFESGNPVTILGILGIMLCAAAFIAPRPIEKKTPLLYLLSLISIATGAIPILILVTWGVVNLSPWFEPHYLIPLAGMIFANAMNAVSIAGERFESEVKRSCEIQAAKAITFKAALIPITNSLFAVGVVSLPGMMTGQILSGVSPLIAVRYQIMVMCMIFSAAGLSSSVFLTLDSRFGRRDSQTNSLL